jgi:SAM-dependent methyltransferase
MTDADIRKMVRDRYADVVNRNSGCCGSEPVSCCGDTTDTTANKVSEEIGYSAQEMGEVPDGANLGLGCGNPTALASIQPGETILDLGSGAGFDCFLAANRTGAEGMVIGVDMTPDMLEAARQNAQKGTYENVEFRLGEIEHLPVADSTVDLVISNCVINLSADKQEVFNEAFRVLKPGGRMMISDIVLNHPLPEKIVGSEEAYCQCISGAVLREEYLDMIQSAGFSEVEIITEKSFSSDLVAEYQDAECCTDGLNIAGEEAKNAADALVSVSVYAKKGK